jgi:hypothetical protein
MIFSKVVLPAPFGDDLVAVVLGHVLQFRHDLAGALAAADVQLHLSLLVAARRTFQAQGFETAHAAFVAGTARLHALADPHFFLGQHLVELGVLDFLDRQQLLLALLVLREIARERQQPAAVQLEDAGGDVVEEAAVVGDEQHRAAVFAQQAFQPLDRGEVQVIGRLVQQQHVRARHQRHRQRDPLLHPAGQRAHLRIAAQAEAVERGLDLVVDVPGVGRIELDLQLVHALHDRIVVALAKLPGQRLVLGQHGLLLAHAAGDGVEHGHGRIEGRLLLDVGDLDALLHDEQAIVEFRTARDNFQQRGLAGAVTADETDALASLQREVGMVEQRDVAESQLRGGE